MRVFARKEVVDEVLDSRLEISLEEAKKINPNYQIEDVVELEVTPKISVELRPKQLNKLLHNVFVKQNVVYLF